MAKRKGKFVILCVLQGRPLFIHNGDFEPMVWTSFDKAMEFTTSGHIVVQGSETVLIIDCDTGQTEML